MHATTKNNITPINPTSTGRVHLVDWYGEKKERERGSENHVCLKSQLVSPFLQNVIVSSRVESSLVGGHFPCTLTTGRRRNYVEVLKKYDEVPVEQEYVIRIQ